MATEPLPDAPAGRRRTRVGALVVVVLIAIALVVVGIDQGTKALALAGLTEGVPVQIVGTLLEFDLQRNAGAAYSLGAGYTWIFAIVAIAVVVFIFVFIRRIRSLAWATVFGLLLGGTLGNLGDRLFRDPGFGTGHVVDFIMFPWLGFTCNVADIAITAAVVMLVVLTLLGVGFDGVRRTKAPTAAGAERAGDGDDAA